MAEDMIRSTSVSNIGRNCALCNKTLGPQTRSHQVIALRSDTQLHIDIKNIIIETLTPLEVCASHHICHPCWQRADRAARHYSAPSSSRTTPPGSKQFRCANCGINLIRQRRHILSDAAILLQIQQQVMPQVVTANDYICDACHTLIVGSNQIITTQRSKETATVGHQHVCLTCGVSLAQTRRHSLGKENTHHILDVVQNWIQPQEVKPSASLCHRCYQRANTEAANAILPEPEVDPVPQQAERIILPNFSRASDTHRRCIFLPCDNTSHKVVPFVLRVRLFRDHNYYIPPNCRICQFHLSRQSWTDLFDVQNVNHSFSANHIEDFCELLKNVARPKSESHWN